MLQTSLLLMKSLIKPRLPFSICNVFFVSKGNLLGFLFVVNFDLINMFFLCSNPNIRLFFFIFRGRFFSA